MTVESLPWAMQGQSHDAEVARNAVAALLGAPVAALTPAVSVTTAGGSHGVAGSGDLAVTQNGTPNMSVNVAAGRAFIRGGETASLNQGTYSFFNDATVNATIAAADATNPRIDLVIAQVRDSDYSGSDEDARIAVVTGTPAASPAVPTVPANALVVAQVAVAALATTITNANITDKRTRATALGGTVPCTSSTRPTGVSLFVGMLIFELDTFKVMQYQSATTGWTPPWNMPWGVQATASTSSSQAGLAGAATDLTSLTVTFTAVANRRYRISGSVLYLETAAVAGSVDAQILKNGTQIQTGLNSVAASGYTTCAPMVTDVPGAGSVTYKLRYNRSAGGSTVTATPGGSLAPGVILVEDIGPSANPA